MPRLLALLAPVLLAACAQPVPEPAPPAGTPALSGTAALEHHATAWRASRPDAYAYRFRMDCFCPGGGRWYRVLVRQGKVVDVSAADTSEVGKGPPLPAGRVPTVDSLFAVARRAFVERADSVAVEYDDAGHYPRRLYVDWRSGAVDDEVTYRVDSLEGGRRESSGSALTGAGAAAPREAPDGAGIRELSSAPDTRHPSKPSGGGAQRRPRKSLSRRHGRQPPLPASWT